ncbi:MAG: HEAT repeat domain-containing protein [Planctomycetota bacterium]|jgi:hypothetical protein
MRTTWLAILALSIPAAVLAGENPDRPAPSDADGNSQSKYVERSFAAKTAKDRYSLGLWCKDKGLLPESRAQFAAAVRLDPDLSAARRELGERKVDGRWMPSENAMKARGLVKHEGSWMLPEEKKWAAAPKDEKARVRAEEDRARKLIETMATGRDAAVRTAKKALSGVEDGAKVAPLAFALRAKSADVRMYAAKELGRIGDRRTLKALVTRSLKDPVEEVRLAAFEAAKAFGDGELLAPYARALFSVPNDKVRAAAAQAIGLNGDLRGVEILVYRIEGHGGGPRAYFYSANQLSFIQDFDVEVAQTAFIADPIVGVLQEGVVLDVKVVSSEWYATAIERRAIYGSLRRLAGDPEIDDTPSAWRRWVNENRKTLAAKK